MKKTEFLDNVGEVFDEASHDKNASVNIYKGKKKAEVNAPFILFFFTKFAQTIIDNKISTTDLVILLKVLEYVSYGNVINLTQQTIADDLDIARQQVNRTFKKLEDSGIFFKEKKSLFVNPNYLCMGDLNKATDTKAYQIALSHAYNELKDVIPEKADLDKKAHESMSFMKK